MDAHAPISINGLQNQISLRAPEPGQPNASQEVESLFVSLLLKEMRQAGAEEGLFPGDSSDTLGGLYDLYMSQHITESGGIGLADAVQKSLHQ